MPSTPDSPRSSFDSTEVLQIKDHRFPRFSLFFGLMVIISILISVDAGTLARGSASFGQGFSDPGELGVIAFGFFCLVLWLLLKGARRRWTFRRPLALEVRRGFSNHRETVALPEFCTLLREGRRIHFMDAHLHADRVVTLNFATQRAAILTENRLLAFLDPNRQHAYAEAPALTDRMRMAPATYSLILLNVAFSTMAWWRGDVFMMTGALSNAGMHAGETYRLLTSMFLHYNGLHLMMNMLALASLGFQVERIVGPTRMLLIYFAAGLGGGFWALRFIGRISLLGASGAVFGLFGAIAYFIYLGRNQLPLTVFLPTPRQLTTDLMINACLSLLPFVSFSAHFGGFITGFVVSGVLMLLWPLRRQNGTRAI